MNDADWNTQCAGNGFDGQLRSADRFFAEHNDTEAKPFIWRADPNEIIAARNRGFQMLDSIH